MEDYYRMIGTSKNAVDYDMKRNKRTVEEKLVFIEEKYKMKMKLIENSKSIAKDQRNQERLEELNREVKAITFAYEQVKSLILEQKSDETKQVNKVARIPKKETCYDVLYFSEASMLNRTDEEIDDVLRKRKDNGQLKN